MRRRGLRSRPRRASGYHVIRTATDKAELARCLNLYHGVLPILCDLTGDMEQVIGRVIESAVEKTQAPENSTMVVVNTAVDLDRGASNFVRIRRA